jgi:hypothetical protein
MSQSLLGFLVSICLGLPTRLPGQEEKNSIPKVGRPFRIEVVDEETGRGVPLVELRTVNQIRYVTDSNGIVAFDEPGLMGLKTFFHVKSHGYEFPKDGFDNRGLALDPTPGGSARIKIKRLNIARRLYRVTGAGIYRDSLLTGNPVPIQTPLLNAQVLGQDSVCTALFQGKLYWFWGDTNQPRYPLGNFHTPGATSELSGQGGLDPSLGVNLNYFVDNEGFASPTCEMPGPGPTWITGLVVLHDHAGNERMFANYVKIRPPMEAYERGLVEFDPKSRTFRKRAEFPMRLAAYPGEHPGGHPFLYRDGDTEYVYYSSPYPVVRVPADPSSLADPKRWESFTCLAPGSRFADHKIDRAPDGSLHYGWKRATQLVSHEQQEKLRSSGLIKEGETLLNLRDVQTGKRVLAHGGSVYWNTYRRRWVMIAVEAYGSSFLGEVWYAEGDAPIGPWVYARKIVSHDDYSFYNPKHHPLFDQDEGRVIFFEGTYTMTFSGNKDPTPRYDYNQIMYQLDLSDGRLALPVAVRRLADGSVRMIRPPKPTTLPHPVGEIAFFAPDRPGIASAPVLERNDDHGLRVLFSPDSADEGASRKVKPGESPLFYVIPEGDLKPHPETVPLYEFREQEGGRRYYSTTEEPQPGFQRAPRPLGRVWKNPSRLKIW